ncbi:MAG: N-6 DNA methylase [Lutibacter sp.]|nr:N-6 DNA methylase [Lutibacter sp.]
MNYKKLIQNFNFQPKENTSGIFIKKYPDGYCIEVDFEKETFHFGGKIKIQGKDSQNITKPEDWVVLECVNRLLEKGYKPENISLEKVYPAGHGFSGRLDICVTREDGSEYLLIECKTFGKEFEKEFTRMKKDGGQLFTYFKFSNKADIIMLYASELNKNEIIYRNEIVKIEDDYRFGDVKDFYDKWSKLTKDNGVFDGWVKPYNFESKALTINELVEIKPEDSSFIFNRFLEILRHNVVSDKGNAFNKIFTLFLCKIYDEKDKEGTDNELEFQWKEGENHRDFQLRLTDLYKKGMYDFLEKRVTDFSETEFNNKFNYLKESDRASLLDEFRKIRLEKNNEFAIKDVYDEQSFNENAIVVKEVVELLQRFKIRYTKKQQYLSDFFELLLTTGLKQESGQFFTPVPVAQFIIKSLPINVIVDEKLQKGLRDELLPYVMDYAAGSGHFLTETMHEIQRLLAKKIDASKLKVDSRKFVETSRINHFDWALNYVYGIEKDYRLVKVGKVGCYLHGDGLANVIHSDGLARFNHPDYKGKLLTIDKEFPKDNKEFDIVVSNPPYSVSSFKNTSSKFYKGGEFELYEKLTDNSSEIECLFIERTKQLLKDGGVAGIILPSSILSNTGIYTKSREIILQYFDIVAITELGSNTFMATGTNTVVLFLRRKSNYKSIHLKNDVSVFFTNKQNVTLNGIEKPATKYINHVWEGVTFDDYVTLLQKTPNKAITQHEIYIEYQKKLKAKNDKEFWNMLLEKEADKLYYFIIAYPQKVVLVKSGEKDAEKRFLGYEFSNRRGSEGIHPMQRGKNIEDCTQLFDAEVFDNPTKASTYIYKAFAGDYDFAIDATMQNNVTRHNLVDMLTFDRVEFEKNISLSVKKKVKIESKWELKKLGEVSAIDYGTRIVKKTEQGSIYPVYGGGGETFKSDNFNRESVFIISRFGMSPKCVRFVSDKFFLNDSGLTLNTANSNILNQDYLNQYLFLNQEMIYLCGQGVAQKNLEIETFNSLKIPLPPLDIQQKIVSEIEVLEAKEKKAKEEVEKLKIEASNLFVFDGEIVTLQSITTKIGSGATPRGGEAAYVESGITLIRSMNVYDNEFYPKGLAFIDAEQARKLNNVTVEENDILFNITGASVCRCCIVENKYLPARVNQHVSIIRTNEKALPKFVQQLLISSKFKTELLELADNSSTREAITKQQLEDFKIPLPPLSEQQKIVSEIEKIEEKINVLEKEIALIPQQKEAVLKRYL